MPPMRPWRQPLKHVSGKQKQGAFLSKKCQEAAEAETIYREAIKDTLQKIEALKKHVKPVTMRTESLATTEADYFKNTPRPSTGNAKALERTLLPICATTFPHSKNRAAQTRTSTRTHLSGHKVVGPILFQHVRRVRRVVVRWSPERGGTEVVMLH